MDAEGSSGSAPDPRTDPGPPEEAAHEQDANQGRANRRSADWGWDPQSLVGRALGDFEVLRLLGDGAMGCVYLARQRSLCREVAVKVLMPGAVGERARERFQREARAAARLHHEHLVRVLQVDRQDGIDLLVMEYVDGWTLQELRRGDPQRGAAALDRPADPAEFDRVARLVAEVADGLEHVHAHDIVHRDVKPQNILVDREGRARLTDFGLAKDRHQATLTTVGDLTGTLAYMSPEQAHAKRVPLDHRTDVFSLGVVLYELLAHELPFQGTSSEQILFAIAFRDPAAIRSRNPRTPRALEAICRKAMQKRPQDRYATAAAFRDDLRRHLARRPVEAGGPSLARRLGGLLHRLLHRFRGRRPPP